MADVTAISLFAPPFTLFGAWLFLHQKQQTKHFAVMMLAVAGASKECWASCIERIEVHVNRLSVALKPATGTSSTQHMAEIDFETETASATTFTVPWSKPTTRRRREFTAPDDTTLQQRQILSEAWSRLFKSIGQGRISLDPLVKNRTTDLASLAMQKSLFEKNIRATHSLAALAPEIVEAAIEARLHRGLAVTQMTNLPPDGSCRVRRLA